MKKRAGVVVGLVLLLCGLTWASVGRNVVARTELPASLTDEEFWQLSQGFSEAGGTFHSENYVSNEGRFQLIVPELVSRTRQGGLYLGVGPEQNFTYIANLHPRMAFIVDIRRGNLQEHLLYKALFEMSRDRADFLSRLWSRPRPAGLTGTSTVDELMTAFDAVRPSAEAYAANLAAVSAWLTKTPHTFALHDGDLDGIDYVYKNAFFDGGPGLNYSFARGGGGGGIRATYAELQTLDDGQGLNRGYLATEANWLAIKDFESRNLLVPVVGDFGGPSAIRAVGAYLRTQGALVSAFYLSNVEQYLNQDSKEDTFLCNVAELPLDETSTFIYTGSGRYGRGFGGRGGLNTTFLRPMLPDTAGCRAPSPAAITGR